MDCFRSHLSPIRRSVAGLFCAVLLFVSQDLRASSYSGTGCGGEGPLLLVEGLLEPIALSDEGAVLYRSTEWRLAVSPDRPEMLTEARLSLEVRLKRDKPADLLWTFRFQDPKPFGLPFSFQALEFTPLQDSARDLPGRGPFPPAEAFHVLEDWSSECADPGRSLFPGGGWSGAREFDSPYPHPDGPEELRSIPFRLVLWGSRS